MFIQPYLKQRSVLTPFQQLLITLMRLRLNLSVKDPAYRFGVYYSTISPTFLAVINILYYRLKPLILWPDRDVLFKTMPMSFIKHCPRCVIIVDCFEIFIDRPTALLARAQTFCLISTTTPSTILIGITPQGTVSFISQGWSGRAISTRQKIVACYKICSLVIQSLLIEALTSRTRLLFIRLT